MTLRDQSALVLFDVLQDYVHPSDPVKAATLAERGTAKNLERLLKIARGVQLPVFYACANHSPDESDVVSRPTDTDMDLSPWDRSKRTRLRSVHRGDPGARIAHELAPLETEMVLYKHRWSAFFQTPLELQLRTRGIAHIILAGLSTDVGIASTAFAARDLDFGIVIARDACWSHRGPNHDFLMDRIFPRMARVRTVSQIETLLDEST